MALSEFQTGTVVSVLMVIAVGHAAFVGGSPMDSVWMWGLGFLSYAPVMLLNALASSSWALLTPLAALAVLAYLMELQKAVGEGIYLVILAAGILMGWGV
ncbi:hypothetical protein HY572_06555 [Candidatus Micrarchaeota archaeon]|nr:hypothetical protein [Candidatus Micrarchaeota archaeon]